MTVIPQPLVISFAQQQPPTIVRSGLTTAVNAISPVTAATVLAKDSTRNKITFINPGSVDVLICQAFDVNGNALTPDFNNPGGSFLVFQNGGSIVFEGVALCQTAFKALAKSGTGSLTIITQPTGA